VTGLNDIAQWLLGGGGAILRFVLYVIVAWVLIGALPRMHRDAKQKVPQVRGTARDRMKEYKTQGRRKPAEWWGWTAAWGALSVALAGAGFGRYLTTSAWHGWGDHKRRVKALRERRPQRWRRPPGTPDGSGSCLHAPDPCESPEHCSCDCAGCLAPQGTTPPPPPDGGSPGTAPDEPPRPATPDRPAEPSQGAEPPHPAGPPQDAPELQPAGTGGAGDADIIPFAPRMAPANENKGDTPVSAEIMDLEAAEQIASEMQRKALREFDEAGAERSRAQQALRDAEQYANDLAAAGVKGPVMESFTAYYEDMERVEAAAISKAVAMEQALAHANAARGGLMAHRDAADQLAATGGAADSTKWYGAAG
jgi:hypothetical protein